MTDPFSTISVGEAYLPDADLIRYVLVPGKKPSEVVTRRGPNGQEFPLMYRTPSRAAKAALDVRRITEGRLSPLIWDRETGDIFKP